MELRTLNSTLTVVENSPNDVTPAKKAKNSDVTKELQQLLSTVPEDQLREGIKCMVDHD